MVKGAYQREHVRPNTLPGLRALVDALGGQVRPGARIMGASHSHLWKQLSGEKPPPTLDTLALYAKRVHEETGISLIFTVTPDLEFHFLVKS